MSSRGGSSGLRGAFAEFREWFFDAALPFWAERGVDFAGGGFFERFDRTGAPKECDRRTRLVGRQTYVFAAAARLGWTGPARDLARHGMRALLDKCLMPDGLACRTYLPATGFVDRQADLYDQAFALFGLAHGAGLSDAPEGIAGSALTLFCALQARSTDPLTGIDDLASDSALRQQNPYMHLFEATMACGQAFPNEPAWGAAIDRLGRHAFVRMIDPATGAMPEVFGHDWARNATFEGQRIEPGHQYEWAWLILNWTGGPPLSTRVSTAMRLVQYAEQFGLRAGDGHAVAALDAHGAVIDNGSKLWAQCERLRAHAALAELSEARERHAALAFDSWRAIASMLDTARPGLWYDETSGAGSVKDDPVKASSLYHLMGAYEALAARCEDT